MSYLERKQVFEVPSTIEDDISYLREKVLEEFTVEASANLEVSLQKYDEDWDEESCAGLDCYILYIFT